MPWGDDVWQWAQLIIFIIASGFALRGFMRAELRSMLLLPFCYWWGPSPCMHDGSHFSLSRRPWVNRLFAHIGGAHAHVTRCRADDPKYVKMRIHSKLNVENKPPRFAIFEFLENFEKVF